MRAGPAYGDPAWQPVLPPLVDKREPIAEAIRRAAIVEDALAHYSIARIGGDNRLTPKLAMAYERASQGTSSLREARWLAYSMRERGKLLDLHKDASEVSPPVKAMFDWTNQDPLVSKSAVLRGATLYWGLKLLYPAWRSVSVVLHHELRAGSVYANGLLMLTEATVAQHELLDTARINLLGRRIREGPGQEGQEPLRRSGEELAVLHRFGGHPEESVRRVVRRRGGRRPVFRDPVSTRVRVRTLVLAR
jgi:hypothetical protein